jgi:UDP-N-acetylglucosamine--N-acetylmuramyl-(pentapeptide) pyrophosphoryl-undecaprenol N-acetylglucosamine transferase
MPRPGSAAEIAPFFDDIANRLAEAQLVVARAGASSRGRYRGDRAAGDPDPLCRRGGRPPERERRPVDAGGAASLIPEAALDPGTLAAPSCGDPGRCPIWRRRCRRRRWRLAVPDAGAALADLAEDLAEGVPR